MPGVLDCNLKLDDEAGRLRALRSLHILDTAAEEPFERIVRLVQQVLRVPVCAVSLVDRHRQWFKAKIGLDICETSREVAFCARTIAQSTPLVVADARHDPRFADNPLVTAAPFIRFYAGIPLCTPEGYNVGSVCAIDTVPRVFTEHDVAILTGFAALIEGELHLRHIAATDHLTGALSRGAWTERAQIEVSRARRYGRKLSLAMLDIDKFKAINDTYGHPAGDIVIRHVAELCSLALRQSDAFGRYGGEEFVLLMPETSAGEAFTVAERIRHVFASHANDLGVPVHCTVSIGVSELEAADTSVTSLLARADKALYKAKRSGRNCTYIGHGIVPDRVR